MILINVLPLIVSWKLAIPGATPPGKRASMSMFPFKIPSNSLVSVPPTTIPTIAPSSDRIGASQIDSAMVSWTRSKAAKLSKKKTCSFVVAMSSSSVKLAPATPMAMTWMFLESA